MAKKNRVMPILSEKPNLAVMSEMLKMELAHTNAPLPTNEEVNQAIATVTNKPMPTPEQIGNTASRIVSEMKDTPKSKKRETAKGTQSFTLMIDKKIAYEARQQALKRGVTFSELVTTALVQYLQNT